LEASEMFLNLHPPRVLNENLTLEDHSGRSRKPDGFRELPSSPAGAFYFDKI